ncbi:MAG: SgcJ/EcaC family oxidoreductase [Rhodoplanes sp.]
MPEINLKKRGKTAMLRLLTVVVVLLLGLALPTSAQKADSASEQAVRQSIETICRQWGAGIAKQDPAAVAALFTEEGIFVTPVGVLRDRQQIKTYYEGAFKQGWNNEVVTLDEMHLAGGNAAWAFGEYTLSGQGPSGALSRAGRWSMVFEHESDGWKIRFLIANVAPPSPPPAAPAASK